MLDTVLYICFPILCAVVYRVHLLIVARLSGQETGGPDLATLKLLNTAFIALLSIGCIFLFT